MGWNHTWFLKLNDLWSGYGAPVCPNACRRYFYFYHGAGKSTPKLPEKEKMGKTTTCPICHETYPAKHGSICRGCANDLPYDLIDPDDPTKDPKAVLLTKTPVAESVGMHLLHDVTRIIYKKEKGVAFKKGHTVTAENVQMLRELGKM